MAQESAKMASENDACKDDKKMVNTLQSPYRQFLYDSSFDQETWQSYLDHFSPKSIGEESYEVVFFLLEYTCGAWKIKLEEVCDVVKSHLEANIVNVVEDQHICSEPFFVTLQFSVLDFYSRVCRCFPIKRLIDVFPFFAKIAERHPVDFGTYICSLMAKPYMRETHVEKLFTLFAELNLIQNHNLELVLRAMLIVFIKCDSSFVIIAKHQKSYTPKIFQTFLSHLDDFLLDERKLIQFYESLALGFSKRRDQRMIKRFLNRVYCNMDADLIPNGCTPRFIETSNWETLAYLIKSRFRHKTLSREALYELAQKLLEDSPEIKPRFLSCLRKQGLDEENNFKSFSQSFQCVACQPVSQMISLSSLVKLVSEDSVNDRSNRNNSPHRSEHYIGKPRCDLPIFFVCDERALSDMIYNHLPNCQKIAIDAEWLPIFNYRKQTISIIQVATTNSCFVIDLDNFSQKSEAYKFLWSEFVSKYFQNPDYLKIGYGVGQDVEILRYSTGCSPIQLINSIDLSVPTKSLVQFLADLPFQLYPKLRTIIRRARWVLDSANNNSDSHGGGGGQQVQGLSMLTFVMFGKWLDKTNRQSDWTRRPLRHAQLLYAALDAYCLIDIFEKIHFIQEQLQQDFDSFEDVRSFMNYIKSLGLSA